jgi:hypothetical protein
MNAALVKQCNASTEAARELTTWMQYPRSLTRDDLARLDALVEALLAPEPVGPAFATTPRNQICQALQTYRALVEERTELRHTLERVHTPSTTKALSVACESFSSEAAGEVFRKGREMEVLLGESRNAANAVMQWLAAPRVQKSRAQLASLSLLAEVLLDRSSTVSRAF